ncbi:MAG: hypothetical protein Q9178_000508 [Gyalolechia marmorata]
MAPQGLWLITAHHIDRAPNSYQGIYSLSRSSAQGLAQKDHFFITILFSNHGSPYEFTGQVTLENRDPYPDGPDGEVAVSQWTTSDHGSGFEINGRGTILDDGSEDEFFDSNFTVKEGSGKGVFQGISGGGKMKLRLVDGECYSPNTGEGDASGGDKKFGRGICIFEGMNAVGGGLM